MAKTYALLLVALGTSVFAIAFAYAVGQRSGAQRSRDEAARSRGERDAIVSELRRDLGLQRELPVPGQADEVGLGGAEIVAATPEASAESETPEASGPAAMPGESSERSPAEKARATGPESSAAVEQLAIETAPNPGVVIQAGPAAAAENSRVEAAAEPPATPITRETFDAVAPGATYADAALKFGRAGRAALTMDDASGAQTTHYVWQWTGPSGEACRAELRFVNGLLAQKRFLE